MDIEKFDKPDPFKQTEQYEDEAPKREGRRVKNLQNSAVIVDSLYKAYTPFK